MIFAVSIVSSLCIYIYFYKVTKDSLNPFGVSIFVYMVMYGLSTLKLSIYQSDMKLYTHIMCVLPMLTILIIGIVYCNKYREVFREEKMPIVTPNYRLLMWIIVTICVASIAYLTITRGVSLSFDFSRPGALNQRKGEIVGQIYTGSGLIGKFAQLFPYTMIFVAYDFLFNEEIGFITRIIEIGYSVLCVWYALFVLASRGTLLLPVLAILYLLNKKYRFKASMAAVALILIVMALTIYMGVRVVSESAVFSGTVVANRTFNSIYNYFALSFNNFDMLVRRGSPFTGIKYCLISLSKLFGIYKETDIIRFQTFIFNAGPFIYGFYHDLGLFGVIMWPAIIYAAIGKIYILSKYKRPEFILLLGMFGKALFVLSFGNYFFGSISQDVQTYVCILLLIYGYRFSQRRVIRNDLFHGKRLRIRFTLR